jgi:hypothetical protein
MSQQNPKIQATSPTVNESGVCLLLIGSAFLFLISDRGAVIKRSESLHHWALPSDKTSLKVNDSAL